MRDGYAPEFAHRLKKMFEEELNGLSEVFLDGGAKIAIIEESPDAVREFTRSAFRDAFEEVFIVWDQEIRHVFLNLLGNIKHTKSNLSKSAQSEDSEKSAHLWIYTELSTEYFYIRLENILLADKKDGLKTYEADLRRLGTLKMDARYEVQGENIVTTVGIPYAHKL